MEDTLISMMKEDYKKMEEDIRNSKAEFDSFVQNLYVANCHERSEHGMPSYASAEEYYNYNKKFIENKYFNKGKVNGWTKEKIR